MPIIIATEKVCCKPTFDLLFSIRILIYELDSGFKWNCHPIACQANSESITLFLFPIRFLSLFPSQLSLRSFFLPPPPRFDVFVFVWQL